MHYNTEPCKNCRNSAVCMVLWGESCREQGGKKIPRINDKRKAYQTFNEWDRNDQEWRRQQAEEQARMEAMRDQLRTEDAKKGFRPYWMERAAGME